MKPFGKEMFMLVRVGEGVGLGFLNTGISLKSVSFAKSFPEDRENALRCPVSVQTPNSVRLSSLKNW